MHEYTSKSCGAKTMAEQHVLAFAAELVTLKERLIRAGLYATAQRMEPAIRMVGFELAGDVGACLKHEAAAHKEAP